MRGKQLLATCFVVSSAGFAYSDKVDDYVNGQLKAQRIPGIAIAVVKNGKLVKAAGYGYANLEHMIPVTTDTVFQLQSITKSFTATCVMMLVEEGKLKVDDKVSKYLDGTPDTWKDITVRNLLSHTSGIKDFINEPTTNLRLEMTDEDVFKATAPRPLNFQPGEQYAYSNTNYTILDLIIQKLAGKNFGEMLKERVFGPLGMKTTRIYSWSELIPNRASGYLPTDSSWINGNYIAPSVLSYPGGGICSTVLDMAKWDAALYSEKLLKKTSFEQMWTPTMLTNGQRSDYGFGWAIGSTNGHKFVSHNGGHVTGFRTCIQRFIDDKLTVVVLTNSGSANADAIAAAISAIYEPALAPKVENPIKDNEPKVTAMLKDVLNVSKPLDRSILTPEMAKVMTPETVKQGETMIRGFGSLKKIELLERRNEKELRIYRYRVTYAKATLNCLLVLDKDDKIAGLQLSPG